MRHGLILGIDIGGTKCAVSLAQTDTQLNILQKIRFPSDAARGWEAMLKDICGALDALLSERGLKPEDVDAIGISCGGPLDSRRGVVLCPPNLPGWIDVPITELLKARYGVPVYLLNDANACALAEWKLGAGRGAENMIFLTMGTGMGGGVIAGGKLLIGASDMAGEIGHLRLSEDGPVGFGKAGSFEGWCSGGGIARLSAIRTRELLEKGVTPAWVADGHGEGELSAALIAGYAFQGDEHAKAIYREVGTQLGRGLALLTDAFNPEKIVIGSIYVRARALLEESMLETLKREAIPYSFDALTVLPAELGETLGDYAAVMTALYGLDGEKGEGARRPAGSDEKAMAHYERLFKRFPALVPLRGCILDAYTALKDCFEAGGKLLLCGNGGSASDCEHIVGELMKGFYLKRPAATDGVLSRLQGALPAISLTGHSSLTTAFANDVDAAYVFAQQLFGYGRRGDVLMALSTSGNSANVVNAALAAKEVGIKTVALTGGNGGKLSALCDVSIVAPASTPADVQEYHLPIYHTLCAMLEAHFFRE